MNKIESENIILSNLKRNYNENLIELKEKSLLVYNFFKKDVLNDKFYVNISKLLQILDEIFEIKKKLNEDCEEMDNIYNKNEVIIAHSKILSESFYCLQVVCYMFNYFHFDWNSFLEIINSVLEKSIENIKLILIFF